MAGKLQAVDGVYKAKLKVLLLLVKFLPMTDVRTVAFSVVSSPMCYGRVWFLQFFENVTLWNNKLSIWIGNFSML